MSQGASTELSAWNTNASDDLTTGNYTTTLDPVYVNVGESPTAGDISGSFSGGLNVNADSVVLGTDTTGSYISAVTSNSGLIITGLAEGGTVGINLDTNPGLQVGASGLSLLRTCGSGQILKWNGSGWICDHDDNSGGTNYWALSAGVLNPDISTGASVIAATSSATTVATFTSASTNTALMAGSTGNYFTVSSNGDVTIPTSRTITIGGDSIDEFAGTGLTVSSGDLQTTLGTSISNGELDNDTIDFDKIASSLTLDEETTIAAGSALNLYIGNNVTLTTTGTGQIRATDLSCTNCIGATEISDITLGTDTAGDFVATITAGNGLASTGATTGEDIDHTLSVNTGNGIQIATDAVALGALTANWDQTGAFDIVLNNSGSELVILESDGGASTGTIDVGSLSGSAVYTFTGATGNVITSSNASTELSAWDTNASDDLTTGTSFSGDVSGSYNSLAIGADTVGDAELDLIDGNSCLI